MPTIAHSASITDICTDDDHELEVEEQESADPIIAAVEDVEIDHNEDEQTEIVSKKRE